MIDRLLLIYSKEGKAFSTTLSYDSAKFKTEEKLLEYLRYKYYGFFLVLADLKSDGMVHPKWARIPDASYRWVNLLKAKYFVTLGGNNLPIPIDQTVKERVLLSAGGKFPRDGVAVRKVYSVTGDKLRLRYLRKLRDGRKAETVEDKNRFMWVDTPFHREIENPFLPMHFSTLKIIPSFWESGLRYTTLGIQDILDGAGKLDKQKAKPVQKKAKAKPKSKTADRPVSMIPAVPVEPVEPVEPASEPVEQAVPDETTPQPEKKVGLFGKLKQFFS